MGSADCWRIASLHPPYDSDGHRTDYLFDPVGRLSGVWSPDYGYYTLAHDPGGRLTETRYPNGIVQTLGWNADGSLSQTSHRNRATVIAQSAYTYDGLGRRKTLAETLSGQAALNYGYGYDALDRLTSVDNGTPAQKQAYAYDVLSNRVRKATGNPATTTLAYQYDPAGQLTQVRNGSLAGTLLEAYLYDNAGQLTKKCQGGSVTYTPANGAIPASCTGPTTTQTGFDSLGRLAQVTGTATASYRYDHAGRRIQKTEAGLTTNYLYNGDSIHAEYGAAWGMPQAVHVMAGTDRPLARLTGATNLPTATAAYYHADGLGSVLALTNAAKATTATQRFDAFGVKLAGVGTVPVYGYTGREPDATGLVYYRARYYDPNLGRFISRDPLGLAGGLNRYGYVGGNPVNFNDPTGLFARSPSLQSNNASYYSPSGSAFTGERYQVAFGPAAVMMDAMPGLGLAGVGGYQPYNGSSGTPPLVGQYQTPLVYDGGRYNGDRGSVYTGRPVDRPDRWATPATVSPAIQPTVGSNVYNSVQDNRAQGKAGEAITEGNLRQDGSFAGKQVTFETSTGQRTVIDFVTNLLGGGNGVVETKTGNSTLTPGQSQLFDDIQNGRGVIPRGQNAFDAGLEPGKRTTLSDCKIDRPC